MATNGTRVVPRDWRRLVAVAAATAVSIGVLGGSASAAPATAALKAQLLPLSALPSGWVVDHSSDNQKSSTPKCLATATKPKTKAKVSASYKDGQAGVPTFQEDLAYFANPGKAGQAIARWQHVLGGCGTFTLRSGNTRFTGQISPMSFPAVGQQSTAFQLSLTTRSKGVTVSVGIDAVAIHKGKTDLLLEYVDLGTPDVKSVERLARAATARVTGR